MILNQTEFELQQFKDSVTCTVCIIYPFCIDHWCQDRTRSSVIISAALQLSSFVVSIPEVLRAFRGFILPFQ